MISNPGLESAVLAVGAHALAVYFGLLALLLLAIGALSGWARRRPSPGGPAAARPLAGAAFRLAFGFALVVVAAFAFAVIAGEIGAGERLAHLDQVFSDAVQRSTPEAARKVFGGLTHLGDPLTLTGLCAVGASALLFRGERLLAFTFVAALAGNALLNVTLKSVFERLRPLHDGMTSPFGGFSFPSGHSSGALVAYGMLAYVLTRTVPRGWQLPWVWLAAAAAFSVGASRIFLQAHFASDVVAGFASGTAWLAVCIVSFEWAQRSPR